jgi:hypothetical protein
MKTCVYYAYIDVCLLSYNAMIHVILQLGIKSNSESLSANRYVMLYNDPTKLKARVHPHSRHHQPMPSSSAQSGSFSSCSLSSEQESTFLSKIA